MKPRLSLTLLLVGILSCTLMQPVDAQVVEVTDPLDLFDSANDQWSAASQVLPVGHCFASDTGCDGGCDSPCGPSSCDAMGSCCCRGGRSKCDCCWCRETLFGDWCGHFKCFEAHGITYNGSFTQFYQGVTSGGANETSRYAAKFDGYYNVDSEKLGLWKGGQLLLHAESNYGENVILDAAGMAPANVAMLIPRIDDYPIYAISSLYYEQELAEGYAATFGRYSLLDFWGMLYPEFGKGLDGFMNASSIIFLNVVPTLSPVINGAGLIKAGDQGIEAALIVADRSNVATVTGLDDLFNNGATILGAGRIFTELGGLPGSHLLLGTYNTGDFTEFETNGLSFHPGVGITFPKKTGSWLGGYVGQQTLWQDRCDKQRRVWFQTTMGWADKETSPYKWAGTFSIEAIGFNDRRQGDRMGIGYFYSDVSDDLINLVPATVGLQDLQGGELYYNAEITPWCHVTGDLQVIETEIDSQDTAVVLGLRAKVNL